MVQEMGPQAIRYDDVYYPRTDKRAIKGNQYTYEGNQFQKTTCNAMAVQEAVNATIVNQEQGKCPIETTNILSRAKIYDMKKLKVPDTVRNYANLYQDSIVASQYHELQKFGQRSEGLRHTVKGATYVKIDPNQEQEGNQQIQEKDDDDKKSESSKSSTDSSSSSDKNDYENSDKFKKLIVSIKEQNVKEGDMVMLDGQPCIITKAKLKQFDDDGKDYYKKMKIKGKHVLTNKKFKEKFKKTEELYVPLFDPKRAMIYEFDEEDKKITYSWMPAEGNSAEKHTVKIVKPKKMPAAEQLIDDVREKVKKEGMAEVELATWETKARLFHLYWTNMPSQ